MGDTTESPLDAIQGRAKALGWTTRRDDEWLHLDHRIKRICFSYVLRFDGRAEAIGADGRLCSHDRALLERDGEAVDMLRSLTAKAAELRAGLERFEADIVRLTAVVLEVPRG